MTDSATTTKEGDIVERLVRSAYEEGVEDGIEWAEGTEKCGQPEWIDSVARVDLLRHQRALSTIESDVARENAELKHDLERQMTIANIECNEAVRLREALTFIETEARRFAGFYPEASDGRNTFVIFADKIAALSTNTDEKGD